MRILTALHVFFIVTVSEASINPEVKKDGLICTNVGESQYAAMEELEARLFDASFSKDLTKEQYIGFVFEISEMNLCNIFTEDSEDCSSIVALLVDMALEQTDTISQKFNNTEAMVDRLKNMLREEFWDKAFDLLFSVLEAVNSDDSTMKLLYLLDQLVYILWEQEQQRSFFTNVGMETAIEMEVEKEEAEHLLNIVGDLQVVGTGILSGLAGAQFWNSTLSVGNGGGVGDVGGVNEEFDQNSLFSLPDLLGLNITAAGNVFNGGLWNQTNKFNSTDDSMDDYYDIDDYYPASLGVDAAADLDSYYSSSTSTSTSIGTSTATSTGTSTTNKSKAMGPSETKTTTGVAKGKGQGPSETTTATGVAKGKGQGQGPSETTTTTGVAKSMGPGLSKASTMKQTTTTTLAPKKASQTKNGTKTKLKKSESSSNNKKPKRKRKNCNDMIQKPVLVADVFGAVVGQRVVPVLARSASTDVSLTFMEKRRCNLAAMGSFIFTSIQYIEEVLKCFSSSSSS